MTQAGLATIHIVLFALLYPAGVISFSKFLVVRHHIDPNQKYAFIFFCLAICPIGLPMQVSRQAIGFCIFLIIISQILKKKQNLFLRISRLLAILTSHMFSVLNVIIVRVKLQNSLYYLFIVSALISFIYEKTLNQTIIADFLQVQWRLLDEPTLYIYYISILVYLSIFLIVFTLTNRLTKKYFLFWLSWVCISYFSIFIFRRLFFGFEFFFPVILLFIEMRHIKKREDSLNMRNRVVISKLNNQLIFTLASATFGFKYFFLMVQLLW
ncbi:hypothetical protein N9M77_05890 [Planktomarina temperata]|nr:hypothetical protein [Planktomarina temperata]